ncbi:MAG TPA: magnesium/cobalt transporter CorA [Chthoniobacterales bacterium]|jgi:magnesium transporter
MRYFKHHLPGTSPATLIAPTTEKPRVRHIEYDREHFQDQEIEAIEHCYQYRDNDQITWINIDGLGDVELLKKLGSHYGLHPLALEDVLHTGQRPKCEDYGNHYFVVMQLVYRGAVEELVFEQMSLFVGKDYVISILESGGDMFNPVRARLSSGVGNLRRSGSDYLAYALMDTVVDYYFPVLESLGDVIQEMEDEVLNNPTAEFVKRLHDYKRSLVHLRRGAWPQREILSALQRDESGLIRDSTKPFLRDCYDHAIQIIDIIENYRELTSAIMDIYLSALSMKTNEVMRILTVISSIFMPLTFLAGIYGMNFDHAAGKWNMPELHQPWGYPVFLLVCAVIAIGMIVFFRRKKWL